MKVKAVKKPAKKAAKKKPAAESVKPRTGSWQIWYGKDNDWNTLEELRDYGNKASIRLTKREFFTSSALRFALAQCASGQGFTEQKAREAAKLAVQIADAVLKELGDA